MATSARGIKRAAPSDPSEENQPAKTMKIDFMDTVKLTATGGSDGKLYEFLVPKELLLQRSKFLAAMAEEGTLVSSWSLVPYEAETISRYLQLLFKDSVVLFKDHDATPMGLQWKAFSQLYRLTHWLFEDTKAANELRAEMVQMLHRGLFCVAAVEEIYTNMKLCGNGLRRVLLDFVVETMELGRLPPDLHNSKHGVQFMQDVIAEFTKRRDSEGRRIEQATAEGLKR